MAERVYIAGPMSGYPQYNFPAFDEARDRWKAMGYDVVSPADLDRQHDGFDGTAPAAHDIHYYMHRDIPAILTCDAIAFLPGWQNSRGSIREFVVANSLGLKLYNSDFTELYPVPEITLTEPSAYGS